MGTWVLLFALGILPGPSLQQRYRSTFLGVSLASIADWDGDGARDLAVGDPVASGCGEVWILSGRSGRLVHILQADDPNAGFGWEIQSSMSSSGVGLWAAAATGRGRGAPYVDVFTGNRSKPLARIEAGAREHAFGLDIAMVGSGTSGVVAMTLVRGGEGYDDTPGTRMIQGRSLPAGEILWELTAGSWGQRGPSSVWPERRRAGGPDTLLVAGDVGEDGTWTLVRVDARTGRRLALSGLVPDRGEPTSAAVLHVDGDDAPDVLLGYANPSGESSGNVVLISGATSHALRRHSGQLAGWGSRVAALSDLDCDGVEEYAVSSFGLMEQGSVTVYSGADGTLLHEWLGDRARIRHQFFGQSVISVDDLDGDGGADVVLGSVNHFSPDQGGSVWAFSGRTGELLWWRER